MFIKALPVSTMQNDFIIPEPVAMFSTRRFHSDYHAPWCISCDHKNCDELKYQSCRLQFFEENAKLQAEADSDKLYLMKG